MHIRQKRTSSSMTSTAWPLQDGAAITVDSGGRVRSFQPTVRKPASMMARYTRARMTACCQSYKWNFPIELQCDRGVEWRNLNRVDLIYFRTAHARSIHCIIRGMTVIVPFVRVSRCAPIGNRLHYAGLFRSHFRSVI